MLDGEAAAAPLGETVTHSTGKPGQPAGSSEGVEAMLDDGRKTGVWVLDSATSTVRFQTIKLVPAERRRRGDCLGTVLVI